MGFRRVDLVLASLLIIAFLIIGPGAAIPSVTLPPWQITPEYPAADGYFGAAVAIYGNAVLVGEPNYDKDHGTAQLYGITDGVWDPSLVFSPSSPTDWESLFGDSVAISNNDVAIGEPGATYATKEDAGMAYVGFPDVIQVPPPNPVNGGSFGRSVALSGNTLVVGEPGNSTVYIYNAGDIYAGPVYTLYGVAGTGFGSTVAISGNTLAVGATNYNWGTVYIFINTGSGWTQAAQVTASTENTGFGGTLALSGNTLVVGEYNGNGGYGDTRIYTPSGSAWALNTTLSADTRANGNQFGESVAVSGNTVVVGEPWGKDGRAGFGDAYIYTYNNGWNEITNVSSPSPVGDGHFGTSVGISGNTIVIGETGGYPVGPSGFSGDAYIYTITGLPAPAPVVSGILPTSGSTAGGTSVTITGTGFTGATAVSFGITPATSFTVNSGTQITALAPAGSAGTVHVTVTTPAGTSATSSADQFTYEAVSTPTPAFTTPIYVGATSVNGTAVPGASVVLSIGGVGQTPVTATGGVWNVTGLSALTASENLSVTAIMSPDTISAAATANIISANGGGTYSTDVTSAVNGGTKITSVTVNITDPNYLSDLTITTTGLSGPPNGVPLAPGTVYEYLDITPSIPPTGPITAQISFTVLQSWLTANGLSTQNVVLEHYTSGTWQALPATFISGPDGAGEDHFIATTTSFSPFAIAGIAPAAASSGSSHSAGTFYWANTGNTGESGYTGPAPTPIMKNPTIVPTVQPTVSDPVTATATIPPLPTNTPHAGIDAIPALGALGMCGFIFLFRKNGN